MVCPFFVPTSKAQDIVWLHPSRLPLGAGWTGQCGAPGHEGIIPSPGEIREHCNLGYATACERLPQERDWDAVRFSVARDSASHLVVSVVLELRHAPVEYGTLEYAVTTSRWISVHRVERIQRLTDCYIQSYLARKATTSSACGGLAVSLNNHNDGQGKVNDLK